jgi:hypothetical protein
MFLKIDAFVLRASRTPPQTKPSATAWFRICNRNRLKISRLALRVLV